MDNIFLPIYLRCGQSVVTFYWKNVKNYRGVKMEKYFKIVARMKAMLDTEKDFVSTLFAYCKFDKKNFESKLLLLLDNY